MDLATGAVVRVEVPVQLVLYGCLPLHHVAQCRAQGAILKTLHGTDSYIGLREHQPDVYERMKLLHGKDVKMEEYQMFRVTFSPHGVLHAVTSWVSGTPLLYKKTYRGGQDWGVWHYASDLPLLLEDSAQNDPWHIVVFGAEQLALTCPIARRAPSDIPDGGVWQIMPSDGFQ